MLGLDTSVVVRLLIGVPTAHAEAARRALEGRPLGSVAISDLVVSEAYFALRHHYSVPHERAVAALSALLTDTRMRSTGVAVRVLAQARGKATNPGLMDRLIHAGYEADDITMLTLDRAAARLPGARLVRTSAE